MATVADQLAWEAICVNRGTERYHSNQERLRDTGQMEQTDVMSYLFQQRLDELAAGLLERSKQTVGKGAKWMPTLRLSTVNDDYHKVAYIALQCTFHLMMQDIKNNTVLKLCLTIATRLEADLKCLLFEDAHPEYYGTVIDSFQKQKVTDYVHKHKVMMKKFNDFDIEWHAWDKQWQAQLGSIVLDEVLKVFGDVVFVYLERKGVRVQSRLNTTGEFDDWAHEFEQVRGFMHPALLPLMIKPVPWDTTNLKTGGYYSTRMAGAFPFIKTKNKAHKAFIKGRIPVQHVEAVNKMQDTAWQINSRVLRVQEEVYAAGLKIGMPSSVKIDIPPYPEHLAEFRKEELSPTQLLEMEEWKTLAKAAYAKERERKGQILAFQMSHKLAKEIEEWSELYFAYNCDFRGRIYCSTTGLTPQGADVAKGLLCFKDEVVVGQSGLNWLAIHGANTYGEDKLPYGQRVQWIKDHEQAIRATCADPISARDFWGNADKPYQFLAFCFDWEGTDFGRRADATSKIPVGMDGSCNGLQHYSAMLRDEVGAAAVNLTRTSRPQDIYQRVADVCTAKLRLKDHPYASKWLAVGISRKCAKRPVMTLPYGSTQRSCRAYVREYVEDNWHVFNLPDDHKHLIAGYLTPILWASIGEVVVAARAGMKWLRSSVIPEEFMCWMTPIGFPVYQYYKKLESKQVNTQLNGGMQLKVQDLNDVAPPYAARQRNGVAPNFVHSIDSTHMVMSVNRTEGISLAMIHDDYGTHAGNAGAFHKQIRLAFHELYTKYDPLRDWGEQVSADLDNMPPTGAYDIEGIRDAMYFFG